MTVNTRSQKLAQEAYARVEQRKNGKAFSEYTTFAKKFPALIHTCGLAQAVAFALAKKGVPSEYTADLAAVLNAGGHTEVTDATSLDAHTRADAVPSYLRLSRDAIDAAVWLKRYAEALSEETSNA